MSSHSTIAAKSASRKEVTQAPTTGPSAAAQAAALMFKKAEQQQQQNQHQQTPTSNHTYQGSTSRMPPTLRQPSKDTEISKRLPFSSRTSSRPARPTLDSQSPTSSYRRSSTTSLSEILPPLKPSTKRVAGSKPSGPVTELSLSPTNQKKISPHLTSVMSSSIPPSPINKKPSYTNKSTWDQVNRSSSSIALSAASLVAKSKPLQMGSTSSSISRPPSANSNLLTGASYHTLNSSNQRNSPNINSSPTFKSYSTDLESEPDLLSVSNPASKSAFAKKTPALPLRENSEPLLQKSPDFSNNLTKAALDSQDTPTISALTSQLQQPIPISESFDDPLSHSPLHSRPNLSLDTNSISSSAGRHEEIAKIGQPSSHILSGGTRNSSISNSNSMSSLSLPMISEDENFDNCSELFDSSSVYHEDHTYLAASEDKKEDAMFSYEIPSPSLQRHAYRDITEPRRSNSFLLPNIGTDSDEVSVKSSPLLNSEIPDKSNRRPPPVGQGQLQHSPGLSPALHELDEPSGNVSTENLDNCGSIDSTSHVNRRRLSRKPPPLPVADVETDSDFPYLASESDIETPRLSDSGHDTSYSSYLQTPSVSQPMTGYFDTVVLADANPQLQYPHSLNMAKTELPQYPISSSTDLKLPHHHHGPLRGKHSKRIQKMLGMQGHPGIHHHNSSHSDITFGEPQQLKFKTTLRKEKLSKKKEFNEAKPWKHHGDSTAVTEDEKKRYEGIWAANKGVYIPLDDDDDDLAADDETVTDTDNGTNLLPLALKKNVPMHPASYAMTNNLKSTKVHGLVVREIWRRSRLSDDILSKIWNLLLDSRKREVLDVMKELNIDRLDQSIKLSEVYDDGMLTKEEFLVGTWLVDQCLYGKKLPKFISEEVWASVENNSGININPKRRRKREKMLKKVVGI